jgi:hypothetical protein
MFRRILLVSAVLVSAPFIASAETFTDDFEGAVNNGQWTYGNSFDVIETSGGNPGHWLHNPNLDTFGPILRCAYNVANFTGDYRSMGVIRVSLDGRTELPAVPIEMSILLRDTNGTPGNVSDDDYAYFPGPIIPQPGQGWVHYDFEIPSDSTAPVPPGWLGGWEGNPEEFRPGIDWNDVIASVDRLEIWWWHPAFFGIFQRWDVGVDNISITTEPVVPVEPTTWGQLKNVFAN